MYYVDNISKGIWFVAQIMFQELYFEWSEAAMTPIKIIPYIIDDLKLALIESNGNEFSIKKNLL